MTGPIEVSAQVLPDERRVTLDLINVTIDSALLLLGANCNVGISFDPSIIPQERRVSLSANRLMLGLALDNVFVNTDMYYKIVGNQIVVKKTVPREEVKNVTVRGYLRDASTGEGLVYANIATSLASYGNSSNEYGYYSMTFPVGEYDLEYSYVGYEPRTIPVDLTRDTIIDVVLSGSSFLNEVVILGDVPKVSKETEDHDQMPLEILGSMASLAGEPDIIRMAQLRAGVSSQVDGFGGLQVRGGSTDQNLILLDGVPVYNTGHALGLFSIFNSSAIKSANLIKGGFPARYGGRLSAILDVRTKEGNNQEFRGDVSISPLLVKGTIEGPLIKDKSSFLVSARRTIVDPWLKPLSRYQFERNEEEGQINFFFYDINGKINFEIGNSNQIFLSFYTGKDRYANNVMGTLNTTTGPIEELDENDVSWGNQIATFRWTSNFNKKMFGHASLSYTSFTFDNFNFSRTSKDEGNSEPAKRYFSRLFSSYIKDYIASYDLDWYVNRNYYLKIGANYTRHSLIPGSDFSTTTIDNQLEDIIGTDDRITIDNVKESRSFESFDGHELRAYIENEVRLGRRFSANIGGHLSSINVGGSTYNSLQPRVSAQWKFSPTFIAKAGYSEMNQYFHLLSSAGLGLPSDVWLPSTEVLPPEQSRQLSLGVEFELVKDVMIGLSAYDKTYTGVTGFAQGASLDISGNVDWQVDVPLGTGTSKGVELEVEKRTGKFRGWMTYTLASSDRTFARFNEGNPFRARNDRRHQVNINSVLQITDNVELSTSWTYGSPLKTTVPASTDPIIIDGNIIWVPIIPNINNVTLPPYHKLDVGVNIYNKYSWGSQKLSIGAYNAYGRRNPFYIDVNFNESGDKYQNESISILPFIPYVSLGISFD